MPATTCRPRAVFRRRRLPAPFALVALAAVAGAQSRLADAENCELTGAGSVISRIVPARSTVAGGTLLFTPYDDKRYRDFRADAVGGLEIDEAEFRELAEEHVGDQPLACLDCHAPASGFPWAALGFSQLCVHELTHSAAVGMVENSEPFHFPILED